MSKQYRTFEEWRINRLRSPIDTELITLREAWDARSADISAILAQFEALAGKWLEYGPSCKTDVIEDDCAADLSALIQSVKERM